MELIGLCLLGGGGGGGGGRGRERERNLWSWWINSKLTWVVSKQRSINGRFWGHLGQSADW